MYLLSFFAIVFVVSAVSAIMEEESVLKKTLAMFITTFLGMGVLSLIVFLLSR